MNVTNHQKPEIETVCKGPQTLVCVVENGVELLLLLKGKET